MIRAWVCLALTLFLATSAQAADNTAAAAKVGQDIARAFNERNETALTTLLDMNEFGLRVARSLALSANEQAAFAKGFSKTGSHNIIQSLFKLLDASMGKVKFLRGVPPSKALVRFDLNGQGFDYLEFVVEPDPSGRNRAVDWFQLSRGELVSNTVGALSRLMIDPSPDLLRTLFGLKQVDKDLVEQMRKVGTLQREGKYAEALTAMEKLPEPVANSRPLLTARATAASMSNQQAAYRSVLSKLAQSYGNDPAAAFILLDHYFFEHQTDKAVQAVSIIEKRVGVDGVTRLLKANAYLISETFDQTVKFAQESIELEPDMLDSHYSLAAGYIGLKKYPEAVKTFTDLGTKFGYTFERSGFEKDPKYADFVKSAAFSKWLPK